LTIPDLNLIKQGKQAVTLRNYSSNSSILAITESRMIRLACWKAAKRWPRLSIGVLAVAVFAAGNGYAQVPRGAGQASIPGSSIEKPGDTGVRAHTNIQTFIPNQGANGAQAPPGSGGPGGVGSRSPQAPVTNGVTNPAQSQ
jgi:hypothetical protein